MDKQVILADTAALVGADLNLAYKAVRSDKSPAGVVARFKKKEDIDRMTKSILKHKIQTLTGKSIKILEDEMGYKPKDPNEPSMDIDTMRRLASSLVLLASNELPDYPDTAPAPGPAPVQAGTKRPAASTSETGGTGRKVSRRSIAVTEAASSTVTNGSAKKLSRRSVAAIPSSGSSSSQSTPVRRSRKSDMNASSSSSVSQVSQSVTNCLGPDKEMAEHLAAVGEEEEESEADNGSNGGDIDQSLSNPTPMMKEMMKKRRSVAQTNKSPTKAPKGNKSPTKAAKTTKSSSKAKTKPTEDLNDITLAQPAAVTRPASPGPRPDFPGPSNNKVFLVSGDPMDLKLSKLISTLPLSSQFSGAQLTVVHTPADWTPTELFLVTKHIKIMNKEAGLESFVVLAGTGLSNVHMNIEALSRHTKHVQFVTFHREDANLGVETGKLRETTSFFLAAYFFPGCEQEGSTLPTKMVRDGYTTCFRTESTRSLEANIVDCFSESGEWILDLCCGKRQLSVAAAEKGRSAIAYNNDAVALEEVGNYLRTLSLKCDKTYRDKDGIVLNIINQ